MATILDLDSIRQTILPKSYGPNRIGLQSAEGQQFTKRSRFDSISTDVQTHLIEIFGLKWGPEIIKTIKECPDIFYAWEVYDLSPEIREAIIKNNTSYMTPKIPSPKKSWK